MKYLLLVLLLVPTSITAQQSSPAAGLISSSVRATHDRGKEYLLRAAEQIPDAEYGFKPTPAVRTVAQQFGHIIDTQNYFCSAALGAEKPVQTNVEKTHTTKAGLLVALGHSFESCEPALNQSDAELLQPMRRSAEDRPRLSVLILNASHNFEHYGNLVTYMRMKGMVPPSSQP